MVTPSKFYQEKVRPHTATLTKEKLKQIDRVEILPYPPFLLNAAPIDYGLFRPLAHFLHNQRFITYRHPDWCVDIEIIISKESEHAEMNSNSSWFCFVHFMLLPLERDEFIFLQLWAKQQSDSWLADSLRKGKLISNLRIAILRPYGRQCTISLLSVLLQSMAGFKLIFITLIKSSVSSSRTEQLSKSMRK